jgi:ClpP class serine protease
MKKPRASLPPVLPPRPTQRFVANGEALAWRTDKLGLHSAPGAMFWMMAPPPPPSEDIDGVYVIHVRGAIEHHADTMCIDGEDVHLIESYDRIREEAAKGFESSRAVVLSIDSPGGVVSGLNECVADLQRMRREAGVPFYAFANEMATSAAYAMCCACDETWLPRSGILGSIGVISMMASFVGADEKAGVKVVTITSGARKSDGHPHVEITDEAQAAEKVRVDDLAQQFFKIASKARGLPVDVIEGYEAGLFLGRKAQRAGLADGVSGWAGFLEALG